jgi:hypothetical protein
MTIPSLPGLVMLAQAALAAEGTPTGIRSEVILLKGAPTFVLDGKPHGGLSYMSYANEVAQENGKLLLPANVKLFAQAGCDLYTFVVDLGGLYGYTRTVWPEPGRWDFSQMDAIAHLIIANAPPEAKLIVQLYIDLPEWWARANPGELMLLSNGKTDFGEKLFALPRKDNLPSLASTRWRADAKVAVERTIDHVAQSDYAGRVVGYQVCGQKTEEWYHWSMNTEELGDYSRPMLTAWRAWLTARYQTDGNLQAAWGRPAATLASAPIPTKQERYGNKAATFRDPTREQPVIDFHAFWSDIMAETIGWFAGVVKARTNRTKVVGGFYAYTFEFADLVEDAGHLALGRLEQCPDIDFIMSPSSYYRRELKGGQSVFRPPVLSLRLHGKMLWSDFDPASFKFYQKDQKVYGQWKDSLAVTDTAEEYTFMIRRELGNALANGVNVAHFDLHGGYYDDPLIMKEVARAREIRQDALNRDRTSDAQVLVIVDEDSQHYLTFRNLISRHLLAEQLAELPFVAPYDVAILSDLGRIDVARYRLVLFVNALRLDAAQRQLITGKLKSAGRWIVWLYAPGYFRGPALAADMGGIEDVSGICVAAGAKPSASASAVFDGDPAGATPRAVPLLNGDQFVIDDGAAAVLARRSDGNRQAVVASRAYPQWTSVYAGVAPLPRQELRSWAARAGVHLYHNKAEDSVYANRDYLTLAAGKTPGPRVLHLRGRARVKDLVTGQRVCEGADRFSADFRPFEVRMFQMDSTSGAQPMSRASQ